MAAGGVWDSGVRVVLVSPRYQQNVGYAARVLKNFGIGRLNIVNPRCRHDGKQAVKYSKHAVDLVKGARVFRDIAEATKGCGLVIGTSGLWQKGAGSLGSVYPSTEMQALTKGHRSVALLIGRDDTGLTKEEVDGCDAVVYIPSNPEYPVLNVSHALAILLYELRKSPLAGRYPFSGLYAGEAERGKMLHLVKSIVERRGGIRDKGKVVRAFMHVIDRAHPTKRELSTMAAVLSGNAQKEDAGEE